MITVLILALKCWRNKLHLLKLVLDLIGFNLRVANHCGEGERFSERSSSKTWKAKTALLQKVRNAMMQM